ncbi:hypothetical protein E1258_21720 [Micromonospora sp. KC207]|uniref:hypothetical protein n=1 Tax=Micromonospora sp. KC207 TaxID=2530377 RepID=UPI00104D31F4|nr:hypothetical protein [Micromonospora sp. KC207]TDC57669.1 hypothetical protein E1258_21720 [Micromonospora sp. KC207]
MRHVRRVLALVLSTVTMSGAFVVALAPPSQAAVSCSGTVSYSESYGPGELTIFYNTSNGGTNSACFYHKGAAYGVAAPTSVRAYRCTEQSGEGKPCTVAASSSQDFGNYAYYAGPRGVTGTANYCVAAVGYIDWQGYRYTISSGRQGC